MKQLFADALYAIANRLCVAADKLWTDDDFWAKEYERLYNAE